MQLATIGLRAPATQYLRCMHSALLRLLRIASLTSYVCTSALGVYALTPPWYANCTPDAASGVVIAMRCFFFQYSLEALLAWNGVVLMHAWTATDVFQHHLSVACAWGPAMICSTGLVGEWSSPTTWHELLQAHPPASAAIASAAITGMNESGFVMRAFMPVAWADAPAMRWAQALLTLMAILQHMSISFASIAIGSYRLLVVGESAGSLPQRAVTQFNYIFCLCFALLLQTGYVRANLKKVRRGPRYEPRARARPDAKREKVG